MVTVIATEPLTDNEDWTALAPGDFVTIDLAGTPVIVTRDREGHVHAMRNVCAHRGATVVPALRRPHHLRLDDLLCHRPLLGSFGEKNPLI